MPLAVRQAEGLLKGTISGGSRSGSFDVSIAREVTS